jgi:hypothetical protein
LSKTGVHYLGDVAYTPAGFHASSIHEFIDEKVFQPKNRELAAQEIIANYREDLFFLKTDDWSTEYEYRAVLFTPSDEYAYVSYGEALEAVLVSERFPVGERRAAEAACATAGIRLREISWIGGEPSAM